MPRHFGRCKWARPHRCGRGGRYQNYHSHCICKPKNFANIEIRCCILIGSIWALKFEKIKVIFFVCHLGNPTQFMAWRGYQKVYWCKENSSPASTHASWLRARLSTGKVWCKIIWTIFKNLSTYFSISILNQLCRFGTFQLSSAQSVVSLKVPKWRKWELLNFCITLKFFLWCSQWNERMLRQITSFFISGWDTLSPFYSLESRVLFYFRQLLMDSAGVGMPSINWRTLDPSSAESHAKKMEESMPTQTGERLEASMDSNFDWSWAK